MNQQHGIIDKEGIGLPALNELADEFGVNPRDGFTTNIPADRFHYRFTIT